tara:strand:- start:2018 stop:2845 length:828 start_codon:yes stop_codon:yes gene_type:complete
MPLPFYHLINVPPGLFDPSKPEPFRHALPAWRKLGLAQIVDRVGGNATIVYLDTGVQVLCVWPDGEEYPGAIGEDTRVVIDDELTVSWSGDKPPGPEDLDNGNPLRLQCTPLTLADGNVWQIPMLRDITDSLLPTDVIRDRKTGTLLTPIKREYEALWAETEFFFDLKWNQLGSSRAAVADSRAVAFCTQVLGLRYRFCDATQAALRILDSTNVQTIIETVLSWPDVLKVVQILLNEETEKKNRAASAENVNGSSGPKDSDPITDQHGASNGSPP